MHSMQMLGSLASKSVNIDSLSTKSVSVVSDASAVVYTPFGRSVNGYRYTELSSAEITSITNYWTSLYPNATMIRPASRKYNCHSYAWHSTSIDNDVWIGEYYQVSKYWTDDFLHVRPRKDSFNQTQNMLSLCKSFVSKLSCDNGKIEKATYMNRSVEALKEESVNINTFAEQVFETPELVSEFKQYKKNYQKERDIEIDDTFETASTAIKRRATGTMTTIKLDKNFDINIHGGEQYIVRGYDEERGMYYYQLFFKEEK